MWISCGKLQSPMAGCYNINMDIKTAIDSRKSAFFSAYDIKDKAILKKIDDLFARIEEFSKTCSDYADFEAKFAASPLNQEYVALFTEVAQGSTSKLQLVEDNKEQISDAEYLAKEAADDARFAVKEAMSPLRHEAYEARTKLLRSTKVGDAIFNIKNHAETVVGVRKNLKDIKEAKKQKQGKDE